MIPPMTPVGALLAAYKGWTLWKNRKLDDYRRCAAVIGDRAEIDVAELAASWASRRRSSSPTCST